MGLIYRTPYIVICMKKWMNSGKTKTVHNYVSRHVNPEPSLQSRKVQRLLEYSDILNYQLKLPSPLL